MSEKAPLPDFSALVQGDHAPDGIDDSAWLDVIHKMDEVYSQLVHDEVVLEEKNAALEQSQQFIFSLLSSMSDVLLACNTQGVIEETNTALCELVGKSEAQLRGTSFWELLPSEQSRVSLAHAIDMAIMHQRATSVEVQLQSINGASVPVDINCTIRRNRKGKRVGVVLVGRPLGDLQRAYQQLNDAHMELKQAQARLVHSEKMASLGRLVAGVAHELNNPISFVLGNVHALRKYTERLNAYLEKIHSAGAHIDEGEMQALQALREQLHIDKVLDDLPSLMEGTLEGAQRTADIVSGLKRFSAVDKAAQEVIDLHALIAQAIHWAQKGTAPSFAVTLRGAEQCSVRANAGQLLQVLINLIQNAYDAAHAHHIARVALADASAQSAPSLDICIACDTLTQTVQVRFHDNGAGIHPDNLDKIFDPFFTTKSIGQGTGLGLSISYGLIEQHGGKLSAHNHAVGGAVFLLELPLL